MGRSLLVHNKATSWLHLASWNLPDSQLSWESKMEPSVAKSCTVWGASSAYCFHPSLDLNLDRIKQFNLTGVAGKAELSSICYKVSSPPVLGWWSDLHILPMSVGEGKIPIRALQEYKPDCWYLLIMLIVLIVLEWSWTNLHHLTMYDCRPYWIGGLPSRPNLIYRVSQNTVFTLF